MFSKSSTYIFFFLLVCFALIQLKRPEIKAYTVPAEESFNVVFQVPSEVQSILKTSCYDCHSNETTYPWYSKIQPMAWLMEQHIVEGKEKLNFDEVATYGTRKRRSKFKQIINQIQQGKMPLTSYTLMHQGTALTKEEEEILIRYFNSLVKP
ncbi:heme-binding domain-containing protein [Myroides odoratus]|uniref:Heme-binding domain-containing protein n=1 Tax=Myroides odoratus TaxID=256 RepID=A0A9Q6ZEJ8_MYROD|nr:heme-binding domain-containing protein [Myroides odoratus]EHQ41231.1 hypothetical protein Myrod_0394 [Myroides odoratus DSM 2801]EKB08542.1 hypothetical protein HMPREF9716_00949 [Myroides odoratus CIP 103059]QQT98678.1 heme-binding domain-containing protein [Myroides odoratus]WQD59147.1 heme-binding domain-containing protein [Myroides odoratus]STZ32270.1 Uncharacterised protein [Myroides odoratus]